MRIQPKPYKLPRYPLYITALELGMLMGFLAKYNLMDEAKKTMPTFWKKVNKMANSFYEKNSSV